MALDYLADDLAALDARHLRRRLQAVVRSTGSRVQVGGRDLVNFASNDYLGLARHAALCQASAAAATQHGTGAGSSRLVVGNLTQHQALESAIAAHHASDAALLFNSGYHANLGVIPALAGPGDLIVSDSLNHASLIDGCRLSRARVEVFRHADLADCARLLDCPARRRFVVSESIFSMDGDRADIAGLAAIAAAADANLILDESHAVGAFGPGGRGLAAEVGVIPDVLVGTFGKAFGSFGGYVAGSLLLVDWLISRARTFIFTTGLPASVVEASRAALMLLSKDGPALRGRLEANVTRLADKLRADGLLQEGAGTTAIFPVIVGDASEALKLSVALSVRGFLVQPIRPPTVPRGTSRLRIAVAASHTEDEVDQLAEALSSACRLLSA